MAAQQEELVAEFAQLSISHGTEQSAASTIGEDSDFSERSTELPSKESSTSEPAEESGEPGAADGTGSGGGAATQTALGDPQQRPSQEGSVHQPGTDSRPSVGWPLLPGRGALDQLEDRFEERGVGTIRLRHEKLMPSKMRGRPECAVRVARTIRAMIIRCVHTWVQLMGFPEPTQSLFAVATLLDHYCAMGGELSTGKPVSPESGANVEEPTDGTERQPVAGVERLPEIAMAIVKLLKKEDMATISMAGSNLAVHVNQLHGLLADMGVPQRHVTEEMLVKAEFDFLNAVGWNVNLPSAPTYIEIFKTRLDILTLGMWSPSLEWASRQMVSYAYAILVRRAASAELPALKVSIGLFAIFLVGARLLPVQAMKPKKWADADWERLVSESSMMGADSVPACVSPPEVVWALLQYLQWATDANLTEIQDACGSVVELARAVVLEFQTSQRPAAAAAASTGGSPAEL